MVPGDTNKNERVKFFERDQIRSRVLMLVLARSHLGGHGASALLSFEPFMHGILENDDPVTISFRSNFNEALATNHD